MQNTSNPAPPPAAFTIGQLAATAGVDIETIRYYQRIGLMPTPVKADRGIRRYSLKNQQRLHFIRRAKERQII